MATILTDNFNSYNNGDLNTQGGWAGDTKFDVQGGVVYEGAKAVEIVNPTGNGIFKTGTQRADGTIVCYARQTATNVETSFFIFEDALACAGMYFAADGNIKYSKTAGDGTYDTYSANTWYRFEIEWRTSDKTFRFKVDEGAWTDWYSSSYGDFTTGPNRVRFYAQSGTVTAYWDYIAETYFSSSSSSSTSSSSSSLSSSSSSSSLSSSSSSSSSFSSSSSSSLSSSSSSSSLSSSSSSSSLSSSSSSMSSFPAAWGIAWGEKDPDPGESAESWATWSDGVGGSPTITGDADWGQLFLAKDAVAHSPVHHFGTLDSHTVLTENKYGSAVGEFKVYYRESDTPFAQDDGAPAWNLYTNPVRLTKTYRQVRLVGE